MPISHDYSLLDPNSIQIVRSERQRKEVNTKDILDSIKEHGVIHPIVVTRDLVLIVGERRLAACRELSIQVPVRFADELDPIEARIIELEENLKRSDLPWQDYVMAVQSIHELYQSQALQWSHKDTAEAIGLGRETISKMLRVGQDIASPKIAEATGWVSAYNILSRMDERKTASVMASILETGADLFESQVPDSPLPEPKAPPTSPILLMDFLQWAPQYTGSRFNLLHCDFPYGVNVFGGSQGAQQAATSDLYDDTEDVYWTLLACLCENLDRLLSYNAHILFWFSMKHYSKTIAFFNTHAPSIELNPMPFVWVKSDNMGIVPIPGWTPRQTYETALMGRRGERPTCKLISNSYSAPTNKSLHPSTKPEPVLRHFFSAFIDETTRLLDPTCGSGGALRVAEELGAQEILGLERDPEYHAIAEAETHKFRILRALSP